MPYGCEELCKKTVSEILEGSGWNDARGYIRPHAFERRRDSKRHSDSKPWVPKDTGSQERADIVLRADHDAACVVNASAWEPTLWRLYAAFALNFPLQQEQRGSLFIHSAPNA
jgi:hypothetical protein